MTLLTKVAGVSTILSATEDICSILLEVPAHERVQTLMARRVLHESRLVAERVPAVAARAVEMRLMLPNGQIHT